MTGSGGPILVVGGVRSGKSRWAEELARRAQEDTGWPVTYLATAEALDDEMRERIHRHRMRRPSDWRTVEEPLEVADWFSRSPGAAVVVLECLTLLLNNWMMAGLADDRSFDTRRRALVDALAGYAGRVIVVSNEVGLGVMPANAMARRYADWLGLLNQAVAARASRVYAVLAGLPIDLRELGAP
jgi:adenosyl cobinamide kinase/adenosyl cobinamide phosphate guanylyltransferase